MPVCVPMATASGELHGKINVLTNSVTTADGYKNMEAKHKTEVDKQHKEDSKMVKIVYDNRKGKHERLTKPYCRYAGDPIEIWHFIPGYTYEVPLGLYQEV